MHAPQAIVVTFLAASAALAAPLAPTPTTGAVSTSTSGSSVSSDSDWTIQSLTRDCTDDDSSCTWTFGIFDGTESTDCTYIVNGPDVSGGPTQCGDFTITSNYAAGTPPWTQFSVVRDGLIIYPSYTDNVLANPPVADFTQAPQPTWTP